MMPVVENPACATAWFHARLAAAAPRRPRAGRCWPALLAAWSLAMPVCAADDEALKAAVLYNILLFVQWPGEAAAPADAPLRVCARRGSSLWPQLVRLQDRTVRGQRVQVCDAAADARPRDCNVLVLERKAARLPRELIGAPVLVVADGAGAVGDGIAVSLEMSNGRVVFDVDPQTARHSGLQLSSRLLHLARNLRQ